MILSFIFMFLVLFCLFVLFESCYAFLAGLEFSLWSWMQTNMPALAYGSQACATTLGLFLCLES